MPFSPDELLHHLASLGIATTTVDHPELHTVEDSQKLRGDIAGAHSKNLFVMDKKSRLFLIVTLEDAALDLKSIHHAIGAHGRVSFGAADLLEEAISKDPALRESFESQLMLWRKGIMHVSTADLRRIPGRAEREEKKMRNPRNAPRPPE